MTTQSGSHGAKFKIIDQNTTNSNWDGSPITLNPMENANMPVTPNGSVVLAYMNQSPDNVTGQLAITSGGSQPIILQAPALTNQPGIMVKNWGGANLSVTNISMPGQPVPIWLAAFAPGLLGETCVPLSEDTPVMLSSLQCAQGRSLPMWIMAVFQTPSDKSSIIALIGGPLDVTGNNVYVIGLNAPANTGYGTDPYVPPPAGYFATTTANAFTYSFNWGVSTVYAVNLSPTTSPQVSIMLRTL